MSLKEMEEQLKHLQTANHHVGDCLRSLGEVKPTAFGREPHDHLVAAVASLANAVDELATIMLDSLNECIALERGG